jgi:hypothetical protein
METEIIDKLDAACRQLNTAISLWFSDGDSVSIHTLACSAHQLVHDINQKIGGRDLLYDSLVIKDEYRREANKIFKKAYNFFKHANNDAYGTIEFKPCLTEFFIMFTSLGLEIIGRKPDPIRSAFNIYYGLRNPHLLTSKGKSEWLERISEDNRKQILSMKKQQFFDLYVIQRKRYLRNSDHFRDMGGGREPESC